MPPMVAGTATQHGFLRAADPLPEPILAGSIRSRSGFPKFNAMSHCTRAFRIASTSAIGTTIDKSTIRISPLTTCRFNIVATARTTDVMNKGTETTTSSTEIASSQTPTVRQTRDHGAAFQVRFGCVWAALSVTSADTDRLERGVAVGRATGNSDPIFSIISMIGRNLFGLNAECGFSQSGCPKSLFFGSDSS